MEELWTRRQEVYAVVGLNPQDKLLTFAVSTPRCIELDKDKFIALDDLVLVKPASVLSPSKSTMELSPALISLMVGKPCTLISSSSLAVLKKRHVKKGHVKTVAKLVEQGLKNMM